MSICPALRSIFPPTGRTDMTSAATKEKGAPNGHSAHLSQTVRVATVSLSGVLACADDSACQGKKLVKRPQAQAFTAPVLLTKAGAIPMTADRCDHLAAMLRGQAIEASTGPTVSPLTAAELAGLRQDMTDAARWMRAELARRRSQEGRA